MTLRLFINPPISEVRKNYKKDFELLIREKNKGELVENLKLIESRITDITSFSNGMVYVDIGAKEMMPSNLMGDGFLKYLSTIVNLHEVKDGLLLIDELDNGLHFTALKNLWKVLLPTAAKYKTQLFITTHSKEAIFYLKELLEEDEFKIYQEYARGYTISKLSSSVVKAYKYDFDSLEYAMENDVEIRGEI
ncbi:MAG: AAA family ATPase [Segetibacter sp.]